jgi:hypothetical protein
VNLRARVDLSRKTNGFQLQIKPRDGNWDANLRKVAASCGGGGGGESGTSLCWSHGHAATGEEPPKQQLPESRHLVSVDLTLLDALITAIGSSGRLY